MAEPAENENEAPNGAAGTPVTPSAPPPAEAPPPAPYAPSLFDTLLDLLLPALAVFYVYVCPFTKVEESFNLQAVHDLLYVGPQHPDKFDHIEFPGVVPRTFAGAIALAAATFPYTNMAADKFVVQMIARSLLGVFVAWTLIRFRTAASRIMGTETGRWFVLVTAAQFHLLFWGSRTIPNTFALALSNLALASWLDGPRALQDMVSLFAIAIVVFRSELVLFAGPVVIARWLWSRSLDLDELKTAVTAGALAAFAALAITVPIDSYFWRRPLWPELEVFRFNGIEGKSVDWGIHPPLYYFYNLVPRISGAALPLALLSAFFDGRTRFMLLPCLLFLAAYSFLVPHKEWRFVWYILPLINLAAARCLTLMRTGSIGDAGVPRRAVSYSLIRRLLFLGALALLAGNALVTAFQVHVSSFNYPGGQALMELHSLEKDRGGAVKVHIDTYAAMNGVSRFLQLRPDWVYDKNERIATAEDFYNAGYTHLVTSEPQNHPESIWEEQYRQEGFDKLQWVLDIKEVKAAIRRKDFKAAWGMIWKELKEGARIAWEKKNPLAILPFDVAIEDLVFIMRRYRG